MSSTVLAATVSIYCPRENPPGPILTGIQELERVLNRQGWVVRRILGSGRLGETAADLKITVMQFETASGTPLETEKLIGLIPNEPEAFAVKKVDESGDMRLMAMGSDAIGAMYAAYELAEQIDQTLSIPVVQRVKDTVQTPSIPNRGIQIMVHRQALEDTYSWFHSETFWKGFLDILARNRFNYLEIQGVYDLLTGEFGNILPYLSPRAGLSDAEASRNIQSLRRIAVGAHDHGLTVSLINSGLDWRGMQAKDYQRNILEPAIGEALNQLLQDCPALDGLGLMVDDSKFPIEFYQNTYLKAIGQSERKPTFLIHTLGLDPMQVNRLIESHPDRIVLELKFNGDHLGLPYPVSGGRMQDWSSYSYLNYFQTPRRYGVLFQIPFNGTHRIFPWGDPVFIRRTLSNSLFAGANGFVLQTYSTFMPHADAYTNPVRSDLRYYDWTYERDWYWYLLWGRQAYDLNLPLSYFEKRFQNHFGDEAGTLLFNALRLASQVIPAFTATCFRGPGLRDFAPEFEPPLRLEEVARLQPLDAFTIRSITEEIEAQVSGKRDGRHSPLALLSEAVTAASESVVYARQAGDSLAEFVQEKPDSTTGDRNLLQEWNSWLIDFQILAALGQFWRDQAAAAIQLGIYSRTGDIPSLVIASETLAGCQSYWENVQELTALHYRPLHEILRNRDNRFYWKSLPAPVEEDRKWITQLYNAWLHQSEWPSVSGHFPLTKITTNQPALLTLSIPPSIQVDSMYVQYQNQRGEMARYPMGKTQLEGVYYTEITPNVLREGFFQYFFLGERLPSAEGWIVPEGQAPFSIVVTDDNLPPMCTNIECSRTGSGDRAILTARLADPAGVDNAFIWWKPFPSNESWNKAPMTGSGELFQGMFLLPKEGAMYALEAVDRFGNVLRFPDMKEENPYRTLLPVDN